MFPLKEMYTFLALYFLLSQPYYDISGLARLDWFHIRCPARAAVTIMSEQKKAAPTESQNESIGKSKDKDITTLPPLFD